MKMIIKCNEGTITFLLLRSGQYNMITLTYQAINKYKYPGQENDCWRDKITTKKTIDLFVTFCDSIILVGEMPMGLLNFFFPFD